MPETVMLAWLAFFLTTSGPAIISINDSTKFKTVALCEDFAKTHETRMEDWIRGRVNAAWELEVHIDHTCLIEGKDA